MSDDDLCRRLGQLGRRKRDLTTQLNETVRQLEELAVRGNIQGLSVRKLALCAGVPKTTIQHALERARLRVPRKKARQM